MEAADRERVDQKDECEPGEEDGPDVAVAISFPEGWADIRESAEATSPPSRGIFTAFFSLWGLALFIHIDN
jgi:hypothetical protein